MINNVFTIRFKKENVFFLGIFIALFFLNIQISLFFLLTWICLFPIFKKGYDFFRPINYFTCWYYYYFGLGYICYKIRNLIGISQSFDDFVIIKALILAIVVILVLKLLMHYFPLKRSFVQTNLNNFFFNNNLPFLLVLTFVNFGISALFWKALGGIPLFISGYHDFQKAVLGRGLGYFEYLQGFCQILICFFLISSFYKKKEKVISYCIVLFNFCVIPLLSDSRGGMIGNIIVFMILYSWNKRKIKVVHIFFAGIAMIAVACIWGVYRGGSVFSVGKILVLEFSVEFDNYIDVIKMFPKEFDFTFGSTYIPCFTLLFPRAIMPNKNDWMTGGEYFKYIKHHDYIRVGERFTMTGEVFMNYGWLGAMIITPFIFFLLLRISTSLYDLHIIRNKKRNYKTVMISYLILIFCNSLLAGDTASAFSANFYKFIFVILFFSVFNTCKINEEKE